MRLIPASDAALAALVASKPPGSSIRLPPGGVDRPPVLRIIQENASRMRSLGVEGAWMMIVDDEIVGLCGFKGAPSADGEAEIGYGVAPARRMRGFATAAVGELIGEARNIGVRMLRAETEASNIASEKALRRNGFRLVGEREADGKPFHDWALEAVS